MKQGGSKNKGNAFERVIAKQLSTYFYSDPDALVRNFNSGGLATMRKGAGLSPGDIIQVKYLDKTFPYSVECKHHKKFSLSDLMLENTKSTLYKAWVQCKRDATTLDKIPMLIFKQNFGDVFVVLEGSYLDSLILASYSSYCITKNLTIFKLDSFLKDTRKLVHEQAINKFEVKVGRLYDAI